MRSSAKSAKSRLLNRVKKEFDLFMSKNIDIESIQTVCLALGPYRNLTTLTGSILFLHPTCQVLNHAGQRIFGDKRLDFIKEYSSEKFQTFVRYAIYISRKGEYGNYGGSITYSHAFNDKHKMKGLFNNSRLNLLKENITTFFWKESLRTSNHIRHNDVDWDKLFARNKKLRFLLPIRNPLNCAVSNLRTGHVNNFQDRNKHSSVEEVLESIMDEFLWFKNLEFHYPERFFYYFEHDFSRVTLTKMADFLQLKASEDWLANAVKAFKIKPGYEHSSKSISFFHNCVERKFIDYPNFAENLLRFSASLHEKQD